MDCVEFQRQLGIDPRMLAADMEAHRAGCAACTRAIEQAQVFEQRLAALLAVPVPDALAARLLDIAHTAAPLPLAAPRRPRRGAWLALAAAAVLVLALGLQHWQAATRSLPALALAHVLAPEERAAWASTTPVASDAVRAAFAARGVTLLGTPPSDISYVARCMVGDAPSVHMVMPETDGAVSVLYVSGRHAATRSDVVRDDMVCRVVPMGDGALVMIAPRSRAFDGIEQALRQAIEGPRVVLAGSP